MKNFVKVLAILLAIFMALAVFAACKEKNNNDKPVDNNPVDDNPKQDDPTPAHEHAWDEGKVTKEATCTEAGEKVYTCSCGETKTEAIAALGHTWDEGKVTKDATVDEEGEKTFTCTRCGETKVEKIDKLPAPETPEAKGTLVDGPDAKYIANGDNTYTYLYFTGDEEATEVVIPAHLNGLKVVAIDDEAFKDITQKFTKITIENGIEVIGASAFEGCTGLTEIVIPGSVVEIGENAFKGCTGLTKVTLGAGTEAIPANVFDGCAKIEFLDLGDGLYELDSATFAASNLSLIKVTIGKNMLDIKGSFETAALAKLVVVENNSEADVAIGPNVTAILNKIADAKLEEVDVRIEIDADGYVFYLDEKGDAFLMGYIGGGQKADPEDDEEVIDPAKKILRLPENFDGADYSIAAYAFYNRTDIAKVVIPECVTVIGDHAFEGCSNLVDITYGGTKAAAAAAVATATDWDAGTGNYVVTCTDGKICKVHGPLDGEGKCTVCGEQVAT